MVSISAGSRVYLGINCTLFNSYLFGSLSRITYYRISNAQQSLLSPSRYYGFPRDYDKLILTSLSSYTNYSHL